MDLQLHGMFKGIIEKGNFGEHLGEQFEYSLYTAGIQSLKC